MDNLHELRQDIKVRLAFQKKMQEYPSIVQFFFTLEKLNEYYNTYNQPALPEKRGTGIFRGMVTKQAVPSPKEKYATFDDYLNMRLFKSTIPSSHQLIVKPYLSMSISQMENCLTHWSDTVKLFETTKSRIVGDEGLNLIDGQPSILTIHYLVTPDEYSFLNNPGKDPIDKPKVSILPLKHIWNFHKYETKEFLQIVAVVVIVAILGVVGILLNKQPYTWIGAAAVALCIASALGFLIHNIATLSAKKSEYKHQWIPTTSGLLVAAVFFFFTYGVETPESVHSPQPTQFYQDHGSSYSDDDNITVYTTEYGECYHSTPNCPTLSRSRNIYSTSKGRAKRHYRPCQKCH